MSDTPVFATAAVAAPHRLAAQAGQHILAQGGNAIEAMTAMAATIAVVYPHMNGIGGDGFWLVRERGGRVRGIEACGPAGRLATISRYREKGYDTLPSRGPDAALTVAGAIGGWRLALDLSKALGGRLPLGTLLADAIRHARDGVAVSPSEARYVPKELDTLHDQPHFAETFLDEGKPYEGPGVLLLTTFFNHQTHHRGQVHDMLSQTDVPPPVLDLHRVVRPELTG